MKVWRELWFIAILIAVWASLSATGAVPGDVFPSPGATAAAFKAHLLDGSFGRELAASAGRLVFGYVLACAIGLIMGIALSFMKRWAAGVQPVFLTLLSLPSVVFVPLLLIWFGHTNRAVIGVILIHSTIVMALAALDGAAAVPGQHVAAAKVLGAKGIFFARTVVVPAALPSLLVGAKQAWAQAFRALLSGELLVRHGVGLGQALDRARHNVDIPSMLAVLILVGVFSWVVNIAVFHTVETRAAFAAQ